MKPENYQKKYKISESLKYGSQILQQHGMESYTLDSRLLMQFIMNYSAEQLLMNVNSEMTELQSQYYLDLVDRRAKGEPIAYILSSKEFWGHNFKVTHETLIPRPDSETLIAAVMRELPDQTQSIDILDLGVGSGCLSISLLLEYPHAFVVGVDIHLPALLIAKENAIMHGVHNRLLLVNSSWASAINKQFDLVIANPPYVQVSDILPNEVVNYEPHVALFGGDDGLNAYREIAHYIKNITKNGGLFICECGMHQDQKIIEIFSEIGLNYKDKYYDLSGKIRCVSFTK